jgi:hypothetical protein
MSVIHITSDSYTVNVIHITYDSHNMSTIHIILGNYTSSGYYLMLLLVINVTTYSYYKVVTFNK